MTPDELAFARRQRDQKREAYLQAVWRIGELLERPFSRIGLSRAAQEELEGIMEFLNHAEPAGAEWWRGNAAGDLEADMLRAYER